VLSTPRALTARLSCVRSLAADLEARERDFASRTNDEEVARARLRNEVRCALRMRMRCAAAHGADALPSRRAAQIARLRKAAAERAARGGAPAPVAPDAAAPPSGAPSAAASSSQLRRCLKVVWNRRDGDYSAAQLRAIFAAFGPVEDVILRDGRKARAGALVTMATAAAAVRRRACALLAWRLCMHPCVR
jgi:DnaJ family protein C protein 17